MQIAFVEGMGWEGRKGNKMRLWKGETPVYLGRCAANISEVQQRERERERDTIVGKYTSLTRSIVLANFTFSDAALGSLALLHSRENSNVSGIYPASPKYNNR